VRVTLYRDNHAWCPYCQKVWLWLEEKRVPYRVKKVTMFCYGSKEEWYKRIVPSGMLPAAEIDGRIVTESDVILQELEDSYGPLGEPIAAIAPQRRLERQLFGAWCDWLCRPSSSAAAEESKRRAFEDVLLRFEKELAAAPGPWLRGDDRPSTADIIFVPYVERMSASLFYYKGFTMRDASQRPALCRWFDALEARSTYLGTQSDFHTHVHDLPPQMGGCFPNNSPIQRANALRVDNGPWVSWSLTNFLRFEQRVPGTIDTTRRLGYPTQMLTSRRPAEPRQLTGCCVTKTASSHALLVPPLPLWTRRFAAL
jgi:glutathione S-transferase